PYATHLLSASDSDFSANNPPVSRTSTPCRDNWTEARVTPEAVEGSAMLSSPAEAVTGIAISSSSTERPECESSAESWPPPFPLPSETSETSFPSTASGVTRASVQLSRQGVDVRLTGGLLAEKSESEAESKWVA